MNINTLRFKYTAAFTIVVVIMSVAASVCLNLLSASQSYSNQFSQTFNPAITALLNGDRDLSEARVAEYQVLLAPLSLKASLADYNDNAQQAYDGMHTYLQLLAEYPKRVGKLKAFEATYKRWRSESGKVFSLLKQDKNAEALAWSQTQSAKAFSDLRGLYSLAAELANEAGTTLSRTANENIASRTNGLIALIVLSIVFALGMGIVAPRHMAQALKQLTAKLRVLNSGNGDMTPRIRSTRKDEVGAVADEVDLLLDGLTELIKSIVSQSATVLSNVTAMNQGAYGVQESSTQQLEQVEMIVTAVNEMTAAIRAVAQNAQLTATEIEGVNTLSKEGRQITIEAVRQNEQVSETVGTTSKAISDLATSSNNIASVLDVIRGIAEQTNLLALNAAIEAARAGEQGRGFAVVADEVRSLASKTQASTNDIQAMIESLQKGVKEAVLAIEEGLVSVNSSVEKSNLTRAALDSIVQAAKRVTDASIQIATSTEQQSQVAEAVNSNLVTLSDLAKTSHDHSSSNLQRSDEAMVITQQLSASVTRFKLL
ncbi:methyl-accepting chemotaxis protein [Reinekea sp.]|jgi:methyl-accepting chemotaxis protein|uniref:methyl-accepting chemotaxis protein n=1 Tax=Reinekea sp. TaxID=1970455 RepID=UPI002A80D99B|nr:methyl-accepting chemotaxis protein [Reinekea sp.]